MALSQAEFEKLKAQLSSDNSFNLGKTGAFAAPEPEKPGILKTVGNALLGNTAKLIKGTGERVGSAIAARTDDVNKMNESNAALDAADQQAIQKAREYLAKGDKERAKRLLDVVKSHGGNVTLEDILPDSAKSSVKQVIGETIGAAGELAGFATGVGAVGSAAKATGTGSKILKGAIGGAEAGGVFGGLGGVSSALQDEQSIADAAKAGLKGAAVGTLAGGALGAVGGAASAAVGKIASNRAASKIANIEEKIAPKLTTKEIRLALDQGRKVETKGIAKLFGKPDTVVTEKKVKDAAETIFRRIPKANKLNDQEIAIKIKDEVKTIAKGLEPRLKQSPFSEDILDNIVNSYVDVQKSQAKSPLLSSGQIKKVQGNFEEVLEDVIDNGKNANDIWQAVKKYDSSIPEAVKQANNQSTEILQAQKDFWLENRRILRDALDDAVANSNLDDVTKRDFKDMYGLYTARENIINNANFNKGFWKSIKTKVVAGLVGAGIAGEVGSNLLD